MYSVRYMCMHGESIFVHMAFKMGFSIIELYFPADVTINGMTAHDITPFVCMCMYMLCYQFAMC